MRPPAIARPAQRGGRRGGLGYKRGGGVDAGRSADGEEKGKAGRSNADFRMMLEKSQESGEKDS